MKKEYLLVGGGIAGLMLAHQFEKTGKSFLILDKQTPLSSSKIAAGMFNPISGKRMTVNRNADLMLAALHKTFNELEKKLNKKYLVQAPIIQSFGNVKESNDFMARLDHPEFKQYIIEEPQMKGPLKDEFGSFEISGSGWVKTSEWIPDYLQYFKEKGQMNEAAFLPEQLNKKEDHWEYNGEEFENIIFCEGYLNQNNPWFSWLPFKLCKGQVLLVKCPGLEKSIIWKRGVYLVHQREDIFKVGASYEWNFEDDQPTAEGREQLIEKVSQMLLLPFEVVDHVAGIRPTTRDRAAILGAHPVEKGMYIFNGLGTKGMLQAPYLAEQMLAYLDSGMTLDPVTDIKRFLSFYPNGQIAGKV